MWKSVIEIFILWFIIYHIILFFEGTRALQVLRGIVILLFAFILFQKLNLEVLNWILTKLFAISVIAILIIFHPEIRQGLAKIGQRYHFSSSLKEEELELILRDVLKAAENLCKIKSGALVAIEKNDTLNIYAQSGVKVDANISSDLIETIFTPNSLLHDGGLIIQNKRISAAGCLFPITQSQDLSRIFVTRHRAALGLSDETDAIIIVVSEERQDMSLVYKSKLYKDLSREEIISRIKVIYKTKHAENKE